MSTSVFIKILIAPLISVSFGTSRGFEGFLKVMRVLNLLRKTSRGTECPQGVLTNLKVFYGNFRGFLGSLMGSWGPQIILKGS